MSFEHYLQINDIKEKMFEIIHGGNIEEQLMDQNDWRLLYFLSPIRQNLLEWYPFDEKQNLLELGAECGAMTDLFCRRTADVTAVECDVDAIEVCIARNSNYTNLRVDEWDNIKNDKDTKYGFITIIGALAKSKQFFPNEEKPFVEMLKWAKCHLKEAGVLILAEDNKYGLKFWNGANNKYSGQFFDGIEGFKNNSIYRTFSRNKIIEMLEQAECYSYKFYYPVPDYTIPLEIYSENYLPRMGDIKTISPTYQDNRYVVFEEAAAFDSICEEGLFEEFANSFLIIAEME